MELVLSGRPIVRWREFIYSGRGAYCGAVCKAAGIRGLGLGNSPQREKDAPSGTLRKLAEEMRASGYERFVNLSSNRAERIRHA